MTSFSSSGIFSHSSAAAVPKQQGHGDMENKTRFPDPHTPGD